MLGVHEVAVAATIALTFIVLAAFRFSEISDGRILSDDYFACVVSTIQSAHAALGLIFIHVFDVDATD